MDLPGMLGEAESRGLMQAQPGDATVRAEGVNLLAMLGETAEAWELAPPVQRKCWAG